MTAAAHAPEHTAPTAEHPEFGTISFRDTGVSLSDVRYWIEDGLHHFESLEFELIAVGETQREAIDKFVENAEDLLAAIAELEPEEPTEGEKQLFILLSERFLEAYRHEERERQRHLIEINIGRARRASRGNWSPLSRRSPATSAPLSTG